MTHRRCLRLAIPDRYAHRHTRSIPMASWRCNCLPCRTLHRALRRCLGGRPHWALPAKSIDIESSLRSTLHLCDKTEFGAFFFGRFLSVICYTVKEGNQRWLYWAVIVILSSWIQTVVSPLIACFSGVSRISSPGQTPCVAPDEGDNPAVPSSGTEDEMI